MRLAATLLALGGLAAIVLLIVLADAAEVWSLLAKAGWGVAAVIALHAAPMAASACGWQAIARSRWRATFLVFLWARVVRESVSAILPAAQIGGSIAGARILVIHHAAAPIAGASVVVDVTIEFITQILFTVLGLAVLVALGIGGPAPGWALTGLGAAVIAATGFVAAQRFGLFRLIERTLAHLAAQTGWSKLGALDTLHDTLVGLYRHRRGLAVAAIWHLGSWLLGAVEVWLTLRLVGAPIGFAEAVVMESLIQAVRTAAFFVPGALGIQEGGFMVLGAAFGLGPEVGLAVSLVKRVRDLAIGIPALAAWQLAEGRRLVQPPPHA